MRYFFSWSIIYAYSAFVIGVSLIPVPPQPPGLPFLDKVIHGLMYWLLAFLVINTLSQSRKKTMFLISFFYAFGLGYLLEVIQIFLPYRSFETMDIAVNALGSLVGSLLRVR